MDLNALKELWHDSECQLKQHILFVRMGEVRCWGLAQVLYVHSYFNFLVITIGVSACKMKIHFYLG